MLKGKSKIELFDAATGAKVLEQRDSNLVTNALDMLINCKDKMGLLSWWRDGSVNSPNVSERIITSPFLGMLPLYRRALGGILLWDGNIAEDPSIVTLPKGVYEVGHAGGPYSGTDIYRGSYNENESGEIEKGWRHVWDFDTDKANGTIKCLSLTSWHGGNIGNHCCFEGDTYPLYTHCYFHKENPYTSTIAATMSIHFQMDKVQSPVLYIRKMEDGSLRVYKRDFNKVWYLKVPDPSKLSLLADKLTYTERVELFNMSNKYAAVYIYQGQIHDISLNNTSTLRHRIFSLDGAQVSDTTIALPFSYYSTSYYCPAVYRDGYYYCFPHNVNASDMNGLEMIKMNSQGQEVSRKDVLQSYMDQIWSYTVNDLNDEITVLIHPTAYGSSTVIAHILNGNDEIYSLSAKGDSCVSGNTGVNDNTAYSQFIKTDENSPYVFYSDAYNSTITPLINTGYLATINNLQVPIVKTAAQTMKITYEIYDE